MCQLLDITEQGREKCTSKAGYKKIHQKDARSQSKLSQKRECYSEKLAQIWQQVHQTPSPSWNFLTVLVENGYRKGLTTRTKLMT
jgi:hypothetical protein